MGNRISLIHSLQLHAERFRKRRADRRAASARSAAATAVAAATAATADALAGIDTTSPGWQERAVAAAATETAEAALSAAGPAPLDRYLWLRQLRAAAPAAYYGLLVHGPESVLPYIYTPTVGAACQQYHTLGINTRGLYLRIDTDRGRVLQRLKAWPQPEVRVIVVTDGERILGLGDLGANGMGISEGKIELYTAAAGVDPSVCLPVCLDVGTNNAQLREHPDYKGLRAARPPQKEYDEFVAEFMAAAWQPHTLVQFEDFGNKNAFRLLQQYGGTACCFNDDIQGTAAITLAALLAALRVTGKRLAKQRILFQGAGEANTGIAKLIARSMHVRDGLAEQAARQRCHLMDSKGLVVGSRTDLQPHKLPFAHNDVPACATLIEAVRAIKPTVLIGASAVPNSFNQEVVEVMAELNERPIIFPLSNPTSLAECTFEQAWKWTGGRVLFSSGSPFDPITDAKGVAHHPPQANNAYIFPAVGHAAVLTRAQRIPEEVFLVAAERLSTMATPAELEVGALFPPFARIRDISADVMAAAAAHLVDAGLGAVPEGWPAPTAATPAATAAAPGAAATAAAPAAAAAATASPATAATAMTSTPDVEGSVSGHARAAASAAGWSRLARAAMWSLPPPPPESVHGSLPPSHASSGVGVGAAGGAAAPAVPQGQQAARQAQQGQQQAGAGSGNTRSGTTRDTGGAAGGGVAGGAAATAGGRGDGGGSGGNASSGGGASDAAATTGTESSVGSITEAAAAAPVAAAGAGMTAGDIGGTGTGGARESAGSVA
ncbi:hypothetical protein HXX76_009628 [Chlamydomonas incerta]|uniref:Malic enzyme n=1 Tax=Chlamydomonas incerta TaxID=51695 RepID=A0A835VVP5_CHLIN|nr:hypothetical protein HXX76_009628 [Chlamydomonas incerta]|eukprot:KAG2431097.1 hypothetical protein HXX76_009628 [Chlamydomonas incerta]